MTLSFKLVNTVKESQLYIGGASKGCIGCIGCTRTYTSQKCREERAAQTFGTLCLSPLKEAKPSPVCAFHVREFL